MRGLPLAALAFRQPHRLAGLGPAEWERLLRQAGSGKLLPRLYYLLEERGELDAIPPQAREHLLWARAEAERHGQAVRWEVAQLRRALAGLDIPLILLKGAAYAMADLPPARGRMFSDIDLLVPQDSLGRVEAALMLDGWASEHLDEYDQRYYRRWMHELPPMRNLERDSVVDVHHAILPRTAPVHPDPAQLRAGAVPVPGHPGLLVLGPADMVLHSATHLFFDGEFDHALRDLLDIHGLLLRFGGEPGFWEQLARRAHTLQLTRPLFYALRYADRLLGTPLPPEAAAARAAGRPNRLLLGLMDRLFERALRPRHASCDDAWTGVARFLIYLRGNWLRMPPWLLARHLFHKAFLSPGEQDPPAPEPEPEEEPARHAGAGGPAGRD